MPVYKDEIAKKNPYYFAFESKDQFGKRKTHKKRGFRTKKEAETAEIALKNSINQKTYVEPSKLSYVQYLQNWLDNRRDLGEKTKLDYNALIKNHIAPAIGQVTLAGINALYIENFLTLIEAKGLSESFNRNVFKVINKSLADAERKQLITRNPAAYISKPKVSKKEMNCWTPEEAKQFITAISKHRQKLLFVLAIHCGMRMGEILGLRFSDIDLDRGKIHIRNILNFKRKLQVGTKTNAGNRSISISPFVVEEIGKCCKKISEEKQVAGDKYKDEGYIICTKYGTPISRVMCHTMWKRLLKRTGIRAIRFHDLRHTCASLLLSLDIHPKVVQELLGHSSIKITLDLYSHLMPNMQADAANAMEQLLK